MCHAVGMARLIQKDPGPAGDNDPPASPAIIGPGFSWHKLPQQKQLSVKKKSPRLVTGPTPMPNASYPNVPTVAKEEADNAPTDSSDQSGRPRWMSSPGAGQHDPKYRSQKPGEAGNNDDLFSKNVNDSPPTYKPIDENSFYIW